MACNPVKFDDLGKDAKDLLNKNFHFGVIKLEGKTKASDGVTFTADGVHNTETGNVSASLESKMTRQDFTFTEKWNTDNLITATLAFEDKPIKGLSTDFDLSFAPSSGKKTGCIKNAFANEWVHGTFDVDLDFAGPTVHASAVTGYKGLLLGAQGSYDTGSSKVAGSNMSLAYHGGDFKVTLGSADFTKFCASLHHKVNNKLSAGVCFSGTQGGPAPALTVGAKYDVNADSFVKAKIDLNGRIGCSYVTKLRGGVQITLSQLVNAKALNGGGHKTGLSLNLSA